MENLAQLLGISLEEYRTMDVHENNSEMEQKLIKQDTNKEEDEIKTTIDTKIVKIYLKEEGEETVKGSHIFTTVNTSCSVCTKTFTNAHYLKKHVHEVHNDEKPYTCTDCGSEETDKFSLKAHFKQKHSFASPNVVNTGRFLCNFCSHTYKTNQYLKNHIKVTHGDEANRNIPCSICANVFTLLSIVNHERICKMSVKEKEEFKAKYRVSCNDCEIQFSSEPKLRRHLQKINKRPIMCSICQHRDYNRHTMKVHVKQEHIGKDPNLVISIVK